MSDEYVAKVKEDRRKPGVSMLSNSCMPEASDTMDMCLQEAKTTINELRVRYLNSQNANRYT